MRCYTNLYGKINLKNTSKKLPQASVDHCNYNIHSITLPVKKSAKSALITSPFHTERKTTARLVEMAVYFTVARALARSRLKKHSARNEENVLV